MGKLDGIANKIEKHLPQSCFIQHHRRRHLGVNADFQRDTLLGGAQVEYVAYITEQPPHRHRRILQPHLSCFDAGQVQDVVDQHQQAAAARANGIQVIPLLGILDGITEQVAVANHRVHRRADLMGHIGEEFAFRQAGRLSFPRQALRLQFGRPKLVFAAA